MLLKYFGTSIVLSHPSSRTRRSQPAPVADWSASVCVCVMAAERAALLFVFSPMFLLPPSDLLFSLFSDVISTRFLLAVFCLQT